MGSTKKDGRRSSTVRIIVGSARRRLSEVWEDDVKRHCFGGPCAQLSELGSSTWWGGGSARLTASSRGISSSV
ncbi:hypothetical protein D8674_000436 [Pyrus ussuriensis x Pyrus communis]|uniref:Uncharacterized protein n=1 Tax=Pyrus ussuriensis x Pyrus communis TaxID=2448454 RepID=A0A5N5F3F0_9ROSA|nr:hypothetical protein D8674_000436 [Pyrus ussuriensis x Pyrus communis]